VNDPRSWGVTASERAEPFDCDGLDFVWDKIFFRGVDVAAPAPLLFRWLCQLRAAPYSYDLLDNFGRPSPSRLTPGLEKLACGQRMMVLFRLRSFEYGSSLTLALDSSLGRAAMGDIAGTYRVVAVPGGARLLVKVLVRYPQGRYGNFLRRVLPAADSFMFAEQLRRLKRYAERDAAQERQ